MIKALTMTVALLLLSTQAEARPRHSHRVTQNISGDVQFLPHPAGCPRSAFCGCGAMADLGVTDKAYRKASHWVNYQGPGTVAVWNHHVAVVEQMLGNGMAMLRDYNSGGHQSRRHVRSIVGARIVGGGYASTPLRGRVRYAEAPGFALPDHGALH